MLRANFGSVPGWIKCSHWHSPWTHPPFLSPHYYCCSRSVCLFFSLYDASTMHHLIEGEDRVGWGHYLHVPAPPRGNAPLKTNQTNKQKGAKVFTHLFGLCIENRFPNNYWHLTRNQVHVTAMGKIMGRWFVKCWQMISRPHLCFCKSKAITLLNH